MEDCINDVVSIKIIKKGSLIVAYQKDDLAIRLLGGLLKDVLILPGTQMELHKEDSYLLFCPEPL